MKRTITTLSLLPILLWSSHAYANMGALLIIPRDPQPVIGLQLGGMWSSTDIERNSTTTLLNTGSMNFSESAPFIGATIGLQNSYYRCSISYDYTNGADIDVERFLMNFDFKLGQQQDFKWLIGTGIGVGQSAYDMDNRSLKQSYGILALRGGTEYMLNEKSSFELVAEYSFSLSSSATKSYSNASEFSSYKIAEQDGMILRLGYNYLF